MTGSLLDTWRAAASAKTLHRCLRPAAEALPGPTAGDRSAWSGMSTRLSAILDQATAERGTAWPQPRASDFARYFGDGDRTAYEVAVFTRQQRLTRAVLVAALTHDDGWLAEAADGIALLCEQSSWCWPAHESYCGESYTVVPDPRRPYLDLGAADVAAQLAWADHVLGQWLGRCFPGLRERMRHEVATRVLTPFVERRDWHWLGLDGDVHNWCPWICGNVLVAALRLHEEPGERAEVVALTVQALDRYLASLPADGSIDEGYEYWWNGACRTLAALDVLAHATGGALDAGHLPVVRETVAFPHRMHLGGDWYVNFADARARPPADWPWHIQYRWASRLGVDAAARHAAANRTATLPVDVELGHALSDLSEPIPEHAPEDPAPEATVWLPGTEVGVARSAAGVTLAVKGGHNGEHHNHNDVGTVIVAVDGVPVLVDAGRPTYTARTFGPDRYAIWSMQSSWHNVPEVRGQAQRPGARFRATDVVVTDEPAGLAVRMDLTRAYPVPALERWQRTVRLDRRAGRVTVADAWWFTGTSRDFPSYLHFLLAGRVELVAPRQVLVHPLEGARATLLSWESPRVTATLTVREMDDPLHATVWGESLTRLELRLPDAEHGSITVGVEVIG